jgi:glycosyltransferase involved in cell wall biosynthesis
MSARPHLRDCRILLLVENLSVPFDRRVWQEAVALSAGGAAVVVICPRGDDRDRDAYEVRDGIEIHRFAPALAQAGAVGYVREFAVAFVRMRSLVRRVAGSRGFDVVHAANPPDLLLWTAWLLRRRGARFVFDHHDLAPELYLTRFGRRGLAYRALLGLERATFRIADVVISSNESYRKIAIERGGKAPSDVFVVRNAPDPQVFHPGTPRPALRRGKRYLLGYVGMMGPQDGVDLALEALAHLRRRRDDWQAVFAGDGDARPGLEERARELGLDDAVEFVGLASQAEVLELLSTADVCLSPEPSNPLNDRSTMMKVAEYMAMKRAVVAFDLPETRWTAADAAAYAPSGDVVAFAIQVDTLLEDEDRRTRAGEVGRERIVTLLSWEHSVRALDASYARVLEIEPGRRRRRGSVETSS